MSEHRTFHMIEAVAGPVEGAPRQVRRQWSDEFKAQAVAETMQPGASVSAVARRIGVDPSQLFTWRRNARLRAAALPAHETAGLLPTPSSSDYSGVDIIIGDAVIRTAAETDEAHLVRVIRAVRSA
ncbi:transposase [Rhizobium rhizogenes]|nr:transposase [Rhizobium rhizogenes]QTG07123.1 transposase [Rhizobium rhizogenes]